MFDKFWVMMGILDLLVRSVYQVSMVLIQSGQNQGVLDWNPTCEVYKKNKAGVKFVLRVCGCSRIYQMTLRMGRKNLTSVHLANQEHLVI